MCKVSINNEGDSLNREASINWSFRSPNSTESISQFMSLKTQEGQENIFIP